MSIDPERAKRRMPPADIRPKEPGKTLTQKLWIEHRIAQSVIRRSTDNPAYRLRKKYDPRWCFLEKRIEQDPEGTERREVVRNAIQALGGAKQAALEAYLRGDTDMSPAQRQALSRGKRELAKNPKIQTLKS